MKRKLLVLLLGLTGIMLRAQLTITNVSPGVVELSYGASGDYSIYDPQGDATIYIYMWVNQNQTSPQISQQYNDDWSNAASLETIHWDNNLNKFVGTINLNQHNFPGEGILPDGTQLLDFNLILRNQAGNRQSVDLTASTYGFQATTLPVETTQSGIQVFAYSGGKLFVSPELLNQNPVLQVYDLSGRLIRETRIENAETPLTLPAPGVYVFLLRTETKTYYRKIGY